MKTRIQKIIIIAAALVFVGSGVSFAHDWNYQAHKSPGKAYSHYQVKKLPPAWSNKKFRPNAPIIKRYVYKEVPDHRSFDDHYRHPAPQEGTIIKVGLQDPMVVFKIILKDYR